MKIIFKKPYSDPKSRIIIYEGTECECEDISGDMYDIKLPENFKKTNGDPLDSLLFSKKCLDEYCKEV
jgi:hypothetical protein